MGSILDIPNTQWRDELVPASFRGAQFHCESNSLEGGRRIVEHQYPKRDNPWAEDMGHQALAWTVRGYCIVYPVDTGGGNPLYQRDYRIARDALVYQLEQGQAGVLQVQTLPPLTVYCQRWRMTEEQKLGGFVVFDMSFIEAGIAPFALDDTRTTVVNQSSALRTQVQAMLANIPQRTGQQTVG